MLTRWQLKFAEFTVQMGEIIDKKKYSPLLTLEQYDKFREEYLQQARSIDKRLDELMHNHD